VGAIDSAPLNFLTNIKNLQGYIAELIKGRSLEACIKCGCFAAGVVLSNDGCTFPDKCDYDGA